MAQSYGAGDPAWADTSDPGNVQAPRAYYGPAPRRDYGGYYGYETYNYSQPYQGDWRGSSGYQPRRGGYGWY